MPLVGRLVEKLDAASMTQLIRDVMDMKPIGPVAVALNDTDMVLVFDSAVGSQLIAGTNTNIGTVATPVSAAQTTGRELIIQADPGNAANVLIGGQSGQTVVLTAGASISLDWVDVSTVWAKSVSGTMTLNWLVRG